MSQNNRVILKQITLNWYKTNEPICIVKLYRSDFPHRYTTYMRNDRARNIAIEKLIREYPKLNGKVY